MRGLRSAKLKKRAPEAALATAIFIAAALFAVATTARGASDRAQVASFDLTQTCPRRVQPNARIDIQATLRNTGNEILENVLVDADAGTPDNPADDFNLTFQGGDTAPSNGLLDPNETWTYTGSYTAPAEDVSNIVGADADSTPAGTPVTDVVPCDTDVIQQPVPGVIVGAQEVSGKVLVKEPGTNKFVDITGKTEIPVGSQVNTLNGTVRLTAALGGGQTNSSDFYQGLFTIFQKRAKKAVTTLRLDGGNFRLCGRGAPQALSVEAKRPVRRLWGSGKGRFTTKGRYSAATVRGTKWLTQDQCDGTLTRVLSGVVRVRDFRLRKNVDVRAGHSYLARARG
jgi:hypothetical protein